MGNTGFWLSAIAVVTVNGCSGGMDQDGSQAAMPQAKVIGSGSCDAPWNASTVYNGGATASLNGVNYTANWWTQGQSPATNSGPAGSGEPWTATGTCAGSGSGSSSGSAGSTTGSTGSGNTCDAPWSASAAYSAGNTASLNGMNYSANWWTQGQSPAANSGPAGSGEPWTVLGSCSGSGTTGGSTSTGGGTSTGTTGVGVSTGTTGGGTSTGTTGGSGSGGTTGAPTPAGFVFSPYKDVTISANWNTDVISTAVTGSITPLITAVPQVNTVTWAFATGECGSETWGGMSAATLASANVQAWVSAGKKYIISTGGAAGSFTCGTDAGFSAFIDRYNSANMVGVDFDIEAGQSADVIAALIARVQAAQNNPKYANLRFSFTIATLGGNSPQSLGPMGITVMNALKASGISKYTVNLMAMDYGSTSPSNCTVGSNGACEMGQSAVQAAINFNSYYGVPFSQIELTPMIGGNDTQGEVFTLSDVNIVSSFATQKGLAGVHFWSLDRDQDCAAGSSSPICNSYGMAGTLGFTNAFLNAL